MKTLLLFAIALLTAVSINAQGNVQKDVDAIKKFETEINADFVKNNADSFEKYTIQTARVIIPDGNLTSRDAIVMMVRQGALKFTQATVSDLHVLVFIDTAIATYVTDDKGTFNGQSIDGKTRWTDTWTRVNGKWTMVATAGTPIMEMPKK